MGWLKLKEVGMKDGHIRKLMNIYNRYDELFLEENFRLFNSELKRNLEKSRNINLDSKTEFYKRNKVRIIDANSQGYPEKLKELIDYPLFLYVKGKELKKGLNNERRNIAVVGTRKVTKFGKSACEKIVRELLEYDVTLISGLAEGIDTVALSASVEKDGSAIAVVGSGLDIVYPYENKVLWEKISGNGILISEHPLGTKPLKWNFPKRNRIIAALSDGILIAESFKSGGALITAELGFMMDKEIFAVPGFINYPSFEGCNNLIKENKAKLVTTGEDIAREFLWDLKNRKNKTDKLTYEEKIVFLQLSEELGLEEIMKKIKNFNMSNDSNDDKNRSTLFENEFKSEENKIDISVNKLLSILMSLKVKGLITETGTARYMRIV